MIGEKWEIDLVDALKEISSLTEENEELREANASLRRAIFGLQSLNRKILVERDFAQKELDRLRSFIGTDV